jgi:uncharacterized protein YaiE (UPF0345 family)
MFKTNEYFDGRVKSIAFQIEDKAATIGVMAMGDYIFNTAEKEKMTVISGAMSIKLAETDAESHYQTGESFSVPANSRFDVKVSQVTSYLCVYG